VFFFRCGCAGRRDSVSFLLLFFCTHVSKHACPDEGKKGDDGCSVPDRGRERVFIHFLFNPTTTHYLSRPVPFRPPWLVLVFVCDMLCEMRSWGDFYQILL
jgi:hypothetical protein